MEGQIIAETAHTEDALCEEEAAGCAVVRPHAPTNNLPLAGLFLLGILGLARLRKNNT